MAKHPVKDSEVRVAVVDDTDVFVLLCHFVHKGLLGANIYVESTKDSSDVIDIDATVSKHKSIMPSLMAGHASTGNDTVCAHYDLGKQKLLKALQSGRFCCFFVDQSS